MDEARRFLRYLTPGALFISEFWILSVLVFPDWKHFSTIQNDSGIGLALAGILSTAVAGFILSAAHHATLNWWGVRLDYSGVIRRVVSAGWLEIADSETAKTWSPAAALGRSDSLLITTAVWHQLCDLSPRLKSANVRSQQLTDIAHSMGASFIGSLGAPVTAILAATMGGHPMSQQCGRLWTAVAIAVLIAVVLWKNRQTTFRVCEQFVNSCLTDALREYEPAKHPFRTTYTFHPPLR